ncbi:hypothetical protein A7K91_23655 [Paenibacillus oryzae]|uniref:Chemotaxis methyl-accepting receptor HlyB-like 4HB MCP domain-containing protein n=1 Tax=Paenibacillus oryzae TaxID=1844972 RepID=A0A1A5YBX8_9BACL|nr:hypothetical protein [Paenibacillus oryzae]OBR63102.1 hypothetical protein A7K91_23655 [Paenibacillus oryzae]
MKEQKKAGQGGLSKALAVTLVILVLSLMGNILLLTKNMGFSQGEKVEQGETIIANLEWLRDGLAIWGEALEEMAASDEARGDVRMTAGFMAASLSTVEGSFYSSLFNVMGAAQELQPSNLSNGPGAVSYHMSKLRNLLGDISGGSGALTADEMLELEDAAASIQQLKEAVSEFNFAVKGDRLSMIRLAGGHEWLPVAAKLQELLLVFNEGMTLKLTDL